MYILGLTGSIGMGKSEAARIFRSEGVPVFDSDVTVHQLLDVGGGAVEAVAAAFPDALAGGAIDRDRLGRIVFGDQQRLRALEAIIHPMVLAAQVAFLRGAEKGGAALAVLDVPLLFETGAEARCDGVAVVSAPSDVQRQRVLARPGMTPERLDAILSQQVPDDEKRRRANFIIPSDRGRAESRRVIAEIIARVSHGAG